MNIETYNAYETTISVINELHEVYGIEVEIKPPRCVRERNNDINRFNRLVNDSIGDSRIDWRLWRNVQFKNMTSQQLQVIHEKREYLGMAGISFDTGCGCGSLDWEVDFSFRYTNGESENYEHREICSSIEESYSKLSSCDNDNQLNINLN